MAKSANTTTPSKFNKSNIMKRAWVRYYDTRHGGVNTSPTASSLPGSAIA